MAVQSLAKKKQELMQDGVVLAKQVLAAIDNAGEWVANLEANDFQQSGPAAIVQDDIDGDAIIHLTPGLVQNLRTVCTALGTALSNAQKNNLRQISRGVLKTS